MRRPDFQLFSSDLDGTLLGNPDASARFVRLWKSLAPSKKPVLVYNTGRNVPEVQTLVEDEVLPEPDYIIANVGTEIYDCFKRRFMKEFETEFPAEWDLDTINKIVGQREGVVARPASRNHRRKSSWHLPGAGAEAILEIENDLREAGEEVTLIYSSHRNLDVLPIYAGKGSALEWLCRHLGIQLSRVLVAGDTGNDTAMFQIGDARGIVPENVHPQLLKETLDRPIYHARRPFADGVIEGLLFFEVITSEEMEGLTRSEDARPRYRLFDPRRTVDLSPAERRFIRAGHAHALELISKKSMPEHSAARTDDRQPDYFETHDCLFSIASAAGLQIPSVREAAKKSLTTLLDHLSPLGLLPVRIALPDGNSEYPALDDDQTVDNGCRAVLAVHAYFHATKDYEFLGKYCTKLQSIVDCVSAYVEDGALPCTQSSSTIPTIRRGTVTGSILWCRANFCYGQLLASRKEFKRASQYLARAQFIRAIVTTMISSLAAGIEEEAVANSDLTPGDIRSSIIRISALGPNCGIYTRRLITAFVENALDVDFAQSAFKAIWTYGAARTSSAGFGDPFTPATFSVDSDRSIYPELGSTWVRFLCRLGYGSIARTELYRLARLNHRGEREWEFNQRFHSQTCEPIGAKLDICSASSFVRACEELRLT